MASHKSPLRIIVVGSGLAGLAAAIVLRPHHRVTVYERGTSSAATGGQGIMLFPNSVKILDSVGFDRVRARSIEMKGLRAYDKDANPTGDYPLDMKAMFGADCIAQKRSDFRDELLRLATAESGVSDVGGQPANMVWNKAVVDVDCERGVVTLGDGTTDEADVVVVADGVHSRLRRFILGNDDHHVIMVGLTCYRIAISVEDARKTLSELPHWWEPSTCQSRASFIESSEGSGTIRMIVTYPIRANNEYMNISCTFGSKKEGVNATDSWHADADRDEVAEMFKDYNEAVQKLISVATEIKYWELQDLDPLPTFTRGRALLIGDAAHAMTPLQGQGANMAIEDAEALRLLTPQVSTEDVPAILAQIDSVRRPRTQRILEDTRSLKSGRTAEERLDQFVANLQYNCKYDGIHDALKQQA